MSQVHDGRPAQTCQTFDHGWSPENRLAYLRRLLAISTDEEELLEEETRDWIGCMGRLCGKLECQIFAPVSRVSVS